MTDFAYSCANGRANNFDKFFYGNVDRDLLITVCDGMKAKQNRMPSAFIKSGRKSNFHLSVKRIKDYLKKVCEPQDNDEETDFCTCRFHNDNVTIECCGTNRVYLIREGVLYQFTGNSNLIKTCEVVSLSSENTLLKGHRFTLSTHNGDVIFMCTDGACGMLTDSLIEEMWKCNPYMSDFCMSVIEESRKTGCMDNQTIVAFRI